MSKPLEAAALDDGVPYEYTIVVAANSPTGIIVSESSLATVVFGSASADSITTLGGDDHLFGRGGDDTLTGGAGHDVLDGGAGKDLMIGGAGDDIYVVDDPGDRVVEGGGIDHIKSSITYVLRAGLEILTLTGTASVDAFGNAGDNLLRGNEAGNILDGRGGADTMYGGGGDDVFVVDNAGDVVNEGSPIWPYDDGTFDRIRAWIDYTMQRDYFHAVEKVVLCGTENLRLTGNSDSNTLVGNSGNNVLDGNGGADRMAGGLGNDTYYVRSGGDTIQEAAGGGTDRVIASVSYRLRADAEVETLSAAGVTLQPVNLTGNGFAQAIVGDSGNNMLGGLGGRDVLTGGAGKDTFVFVALGDSTVASAERDKIVDFSQAEGDCIDLRSIDADTGLAKDQAFTFIGTAAFGGVAGQLRFISAGGVNTVVSGDVDGDGAADFAITLSGLINLQQADFLL